jgi:glycerol-3-phosphate dehydrogenase
VHRRSPRLPSERPLYAPDEAGQDRRGISRGYHLLDHAANGVENAATIVGGKPTTYRQMAVATADLVCDQLGVDAACATADRPLPGHDDPAQLDEYVDRFDSRGPTDADIVN